MEAAVNATEREATLHYYLERCPLFSQWNSGDKNRLLATAREFRLAAGQTLFDYGETRKHLYLILSGSMKGVVLTREGNEAIIDVAGVGQWFGGLNIIDDRPHQHAAVALEATHGVGFDGTLIRSIVEANPELYRAVVLLLCERLRNLFNWAEDSLLCSLRQRVLVQLERLATRSGTPHENGLLIRTRLSQDVLAAMLGVTRQTLNKELKELKQAGLIRKIGQHYWIRQEPAC